MAANTRVIKICFIAPKAYPLFNADVKEIFGGAEVDLYLLATELAKDKNFAVSFITADYGQEITKTIEGVKVIKSVDFKKNPLSGAIRIWRAMHIADAQIYLIKTASVGTPLVALFCKLHGRAFVYRTANTYECDGTYLREHRLLGRSFAWSLRQAKIVFAQNTIDAENLSATIGIRSRVIPNGHRLSQLHQKQRDTILWAGRSAKIKKPGLFIDLAETIPDEKFTMICQRATGDEKYVQLVARAKQVENLEFIERVDFDEIEGYFQRAKVFVNTSVAEGFPNTFIQACKCGTAVLSLNVNPDGFLDKYKCGVCADGSWDKFINELKMLTEPGKAEEYGPNGRRYVEENHDIEKIVQQCKTIFIELIKTSK